MSTFRQDLVKIGVENGLLALLILVAGAVFSRSLEKLKSSLSWGAEVLKQRLALAKEILSDLREMDDAHLQVLGTLVSTGATHQEQMARFMDAMKKIEATCAEARLLLSEATVSAVESTRFVAMRWMTDEAQPTGQLGSINTSGEGPVVAKVPDDSVAEWFKSARKQLEDSIRHAVSRVQSEFPKVGGF